MRPAAAATRPPSSTDLALPRIGGIYRRRADGASSLHTVQYLDTVRYMDTTLPPGPRYPRALQTLGWGVRPMPFMERCHARYGDIFTLRIAQEGTWVMLAHPDMVKQVFTGDPAVFHAGEGNVILRPLVGSNSVLHSTTRRTWPSASCCCRRSTASGCRATGS